MATCYTMWLEQVLLSRFYFLRCLIITAVLFLFVSTLHTSRKLVERKFLNYKKHKAMRWQSKLVSTPKFVYRHILMNDKELQLDSILLLPCHEAVVLCRTDLLSLIMYLVIGVSETERLYTITYTHMHTHTHTYLNFLLSFICAMLFVSRLHWMVRW